MNKTEQQNLCDGLSLDRDKHPRNPPTAAEFAALAVQVAIMRGSTAPDYDGAWITYWNASHILAGKLHPQPKQAPPEPLDPKVERYGRPPYAEGFPLSVVAFWAKVTGHPARKRWEREKAAILERIKGDESEAGERALAAFAYIEGQRKQKAAFIDQGLFQYCRECFLPYMERPAPAPRKRKQTGENKGAFTAPKRGQSGQFRKK